MDSHINTIKATIFLFVCHLLLLCCLIRVCRRDKSCSGIFWWHGNHHWAVFLAAYTEDYRTVLQKCSSLQLICFQWHFRDLFCSRGSLQPQGLSHCNYLEDRHRVEDSGCCTGLHASTQSQHLFFSTLGQLFWAVLVSFVLVTGTCELLSAHCCWCAPHHTALMQWRICYGLS